MCWTSYPKRKGERCLISFAIVFISDENFRCYSQTGDHVDGDGDGDGSEVDGKCK